MSVRVCFVGTGGIADRHLETLSQMPNVEIVALCDLVEELVRAKTEIHHATAYTDFREMLEQENLDALFICVPPFAHGEIELTAIEKGLPLFVEKPVAVNLQMAKPILEAVQKSDLITAVAYKFRWDDHIIQAKELLQDKTVGLVVGHYWLSMPGVAWWRVQEQSGGQMVEQTTHFVDLARYLCGEITHVQAFAAHRVMHHKYPDCTAADAASVNLRFASGAIGNISNTFILAGGGSTELDVMAEEFRLAVAGDVVRWWSEDESGQILKQINGYVAEVEAFITAVETGDRSGIYSDYTDAYRTLAVTVAANVSAEQGGRLVEIEHI